MKVQLNNILTTLNLNPKAYSQLEKVVLEYGSLVQKMSNIEQESWFFRRARENNLIKIKELKNTFYEIRKAVNSVSLSRLSTEIATPPVIILPKRILSLL